MTRITDIVPGDEVVGHMRMGRALEIRRHKDGSAYREVPTTIRIAPPLALTKFRGVVLQNDTVARVLTISTVAVGSRLQPEQHGVGLTTDIHYSMFHRLLVFSPHSYPPRDKTHHSGRTTLPVNQTINSEYLPYRTVVSVVI